MYGSAGTVTAASPQRHRSVTARFNPRCYWPATGVELARDDGEQQQGRHQ
jgi:hypothetical protein